MSFSPENPTTSIAATTHPRDEAQKYGMVEAWELGLLPGPHGTDRLVTPPADTEVARTDILTSHEVFELGGTFGHRRNMRADHLIWARKTKHVFKTLKTKFSIV